MCRVSDTYVTNVIMLPQQQAVLSVTKSHGMRVSCTHVIIVIMLPQEQNILSDTKSQNIIVSDTHDLWLCGDQS